MKEISKVMGVSESRVCQLRMQAIMRLRVALYTYQSGEERLNAIGEMGEKCRSQVGKKGENPQAIVSRGSRQRGS